MQKEEKPTSVNDLIEEQLKKLAKANPEPLVDEVRYCIHSASKIIDAIVLDKTKRAFADMRPHADLYSEPSQKYGISVTVVPCTLAEAREYWLREHPVGGFFEEMLDTIQKPFALLLKVQGKKGLIFVIANISPKKPETSVNLAVWPLSKEFGEHVPVTLPIELLPDDLITKLTKELKVTKV